MATGSPAREFTTEELDALAAAELPAWDQSAPTAPAPSEPLRGPAMGPVAQLEAGREYSTEELDVLEKSTTPPPPKEFTTEELDMEAARLFDDPTYAPTRDEYFELKATKERLKAEGKLPGTAELAAKAVGGFFVTAADLFYTMAVDPEGSVTRIPETLDRINQGTLKEPKSEALAKAPATLQTGIGRAALGAMQLGGWAKEAIQGTPKYRDEETGEFFFFNNEVQLQDALDAGRKLRPTTEDDLKDHEFENYIAKKGIDAEYQDLSEKTAPTELLTRLITGRNQQETPILAQADALEIGADFTNIIPFGAGAKTLGLSRLGKTVSAQTAGVISKVAGGLADGGDALAGRFADVVTNATGLTPSTAGNVVKTLTRTSVGGGIAAGASALGAPPEVAATIAGFYPAYKAGIGVLRKIETGAGAAKIILRESADATNGLDQAARAAVLANPSVPQVFKEVLERPTNFVPIESTPARLAAEQSLSPQMLMGKLSNPAIVQSVRGASALAKGAVKGTAINAPFSLLAANAGDDEEAAAMLGAGATFGALGGGVDRFTGLQQRRQQAELSDVSRMLVDVESSYAKLREAAKLKNEPLPEANISRMLVDVELAGGDVGKMMSTQTFANLSKLASLQGTFRNALDFIPLNATDYNANVAAQGGAGSAGLHVQAPAGQRAKVYINLDAKRQGIEPHEFGHALLASGALDGQQKFAARAWVDKTYGAEGIKARAAEYASNIIRAKNAEAFPEGNFEITPTTLASEMESLTQGGLARGDMDGLDWARDEIFAETFAKASETMDFNAIRRGAPAGGNFLTFAEGILGAQARALSASGVRIDPQTGAPLEKPADLFAKNPLLATDKALVKQLGTYINNYRQWANNPGHEKPAGVRVAPSGRASDIANNPQVTFYDRGDGIKANAFAIQDPATGQAILRDQRDLNAAHAKVREQLKALGGSKLLEPGNPVLGPKKTADGRVTIRGKVLPPQFDFLNGFMPHIRNFARQFEQFGQTGESMQVRYHAIGSGDSGAFRIKNLGNLEAITREVLPFEWQLTKAGNLNAVVLDLTQFRNRALRAINNRNEALAPFNFEIGQLEADLKVWMDNHRNNLPGENKIGTEKRDAINALVGLATTQNRAKNPLNGSFGPGSAIKQFRLDRVDAAIGTGRQGFHFDYDKANGNRLPEIQSPLPDLSQDLPGQGMPDIAVVPERFTGTGQETGRQSRFVKPPPFFSRYSIESYEKGGKFFDTQTGDDLTGKSFGAGFIDVSSGKPRLFVDGEPNTQAAASGRTYRTNLFKQKAGWQWISSNAPQTSTIVSVEGGGRHVYALRADFEGGVDLARYSDKPSEPRLRPTAKGELLLGTEVGRINIRGKEHSVYDTARIAAPQGQAMPDVVHSTGYTLPKKTPQRGYFSIGTKPTADGRVLEYHVDPTTTIQPRVATINSIRREQVAMLEADRHNTRGDNMGGPLHPFLISNQTVARLPDGRGYKAVWANMNSAFVTRAKNIVKNTTAGHALVQIMKENAHRSNRKFVMDVTAEIDKRSASMSKDQTDFLHVLLELGAINPQSRINQATGKLERTAKAALSKEVTMEELAEAQKDYDATLKKYQPMVEFLSRLSPMKSHATRGRMDAFDNEFATILSKYKKQPWFDSMASKYRNTKFVDEAARFSFNQRGAAMDRITGIPFAPDVKAMLKNSMDFVNGQNLDVVGVVQLSKDADAFAVYFGKNLKEEAKMSANERLLRDQLLDSGSFKPHPSYDWVMLGPENADSFILDTPADPLKLFPDYAKNHPNKNVQKGSKETIVGTMKKSKIPLVLK